MTPQTKLVGLARDGDKYFALVANGAPNDTRAGHDHLHAVTRQEMPREEVNRLYREAQGQDCISEIDWHEGEESWTVYFDLGLAMRHDWKLHWSLMKEVDDTHEAFLAGTRG